MTCLLLGFKNQLIGNYDLMVHVYFINCDLLFMAVWSHYKPTGHM